MTTAFDSNDLRRTQRLLLTPKGEIANGAAPIKTLIRNVSNEGMLLACDKVFSPGQTLKLKFQASAGEIISCEVEVRHSSDAGTGVEIVTMSHEHRRAYRDYLQDYAARQSR
jgi:hypothetical protein